MVPEFKIKRNKYYIEKENQVIAELYTSRVKNNNFIKGDFISIWGVFVKEECRNMGYGKLLLNSFISHIKKQHSIIELNTELNNAAAINLYTSLGFKEYRRNGPYVYMALDIDF